MKKTTLGLVLIPCLIGGFAFVRFHNSIPDGNLSSDSLTCSLAAYKEYTHIIPAAGEMGLPFSSNAGTRAEQVALLEAYDALKLTGEATSVVVAHIPSKNLTVQTCAEERCTMDEQGKPMQVCLKQTYSDCVYLATRFQNTNYCLIAPSED